MQCGCFCTECQDPETFERTTNSTVCNNPFSGFECLANDDTVCGPEFSDETEIVWCEIPQPPRFPPLFDLTNAQRPIPGATNTTEDGVAPTDTSFLWLGGGDAAFTQALVQGIARQPSVQQALTNPEVINGIAVRTSLWSFHSVQSRARGWVPPAMDNVTTHRRCLACDRSQSKP